MPPEGSRGRTSVDADLLHSLLPAVHHWLLASPCHQPLPGLDIRPALAPGAAWELVELMIDEACPPGCEA
jgi:hypothetical protein